MCLAQSWSSFREGSCQRGQTFTFHLSRKALTKQSKPGNEQEPFLRFGDLPWTIFRGDTKICLYMHFADALQVTVNEQCICSFSSHTLFSFTVCHPVTPLNTSSTWKHTHAERNPLQLLRSESIRWNLMNSFNKWSFSLIHLKIYLFPNPDPPYLTCSSSSVHFHVWWWGVSSSLAACLQRRLRKSP